MTSNQPGGTVLVGGASGLIGSRLVTDLRASGWSVRTLVRGDERGPDEVAWSPSSGELPDRALDGVDAVVVLSGAGIGDRRWTPRYRRELVSSRTRPVSLLATRIAQRVAAGHAPVRLVTASAVGYYGDRGDRLLSDSPDAGPGTGFLADLCVAWERAARPAEAAGCAVAHTRTGIVLSRSGGALARLLPLVRLGVAGPLGTGRQWWPWITLADEVRAIIHLLGSDLRGGVNLTAPNPARNGDLIRALARAAHRPAAVPVPGWALRIALGGFASDLLASQRVVPDALARDGFEFTTTRIEDAANAILA